MSPSHAMRAVLLSMVVFVCAACLTQPEAPLSYGRCTGGETCGLETQCDRVTASTTGAAALVCTLPCARDGDCPGLGARCVAGVATGASDGGLTGRCLRVCEADADCRPGTVCRALASDAGTARVCVASLTM